METVDFKINFSAIGHTNNNENDMPSLDLENFLHIPRQRGILTNGSILVIIMIAPSETFLTIPVLISALIGLGVPGVFSRVCTYSISVCFTWKSECADYKTLQVIYQGHTPVLHCASLLCIISRVISARVKNGAFLFTSWPRHRGKSSFYRKRVQCRPIIVFLLFWTE